MQEQDTLEMFQLQEIFILDQLPQILQFEERELTVRNSYNAESLYEWNIDGMSQYEILNELDEMLMVSNVYKSNNKTNH